MPKLHIVEERLPLIFPEGTKNRQNHINITAARTIFVLLYLGAVEGTEVWLRPDQVTRMTDSQAAMIDNDSRLAWRKTSMKVIPKDQPILGRWYEVNSREGIRDDCLRYALCETGAVIVRLGLATTSSAGRYALEKDFSMLFDPALSDLEFEIAVDSWASKHLSTSAIMRKQLAQRAASQNEGTVKVVFPNNEVRMLAPGPSSGITKAVIEDFSKHFLIQPAVVWISESANKEERSDRELANAIGLNIEVDKHLPDVILADIGTQEPLIVFIEVVASDGPINDTKKDGLMLLIKKSTKLKESQAVFVTAYADREDRAFKKTFSVLAWQSFAWCMSEPDKIIGLYEQTGTRKLTDLLTD
ncbi:restriction endonuclease [Shewanella sp. JBTF-M18]|uniref:Restriction endonuclease n=1 Tax=Shewanella insulae TaxID=2681496 RepID=A0A6L7I156_9GAMM|nr:BsuBI/PstI family type II restriction endonuclease [Shewanella insulae]MXR70306.1 restriction endonuclease [Shewanella insulae]